MPRKLGQLQEPGIYLQPDGTYLVRSARRAGSTAAVFWPGCDSLKEARARLASAAEIRSAGGDVADVWRRERERSTNNPAAGALYFDVAAETWLADREERMNASDHSRSGLHRGRHTLRPDSHDRSVSTVRELQTRFGTLPTTEITRSVVDRYVTELAGRGLAVSSQDRLLQTLRQLIGQLGRRHQPDDFPWKGVGAVDPANPLRRPPNPEVWNGKPNEDPPALPFEKARAIALAMRTASRIVVYLMAFMGLRRGEVFGLELRHLRVEDDGTLVLRIAQQRDLRTGRLKEWVKSDNGYRNLPVPPVLARYLVDYVRRYHPGVDLHSQHDRPSRRLVVTSTGRDIDGSFMAMHPSTWAHQFASALVDAGCSYDDIGYDLDPHHLRRSCSTYLLNAEAILRAIDDAAAGEEPGPDEPLERRAAWLEQQLAAARRREDAANIQGADISEWLGHEVRADHRNAEAASPTTLTNYLRAFGSPLHRMVAVANVLDTIVVDEVGELVDEPDEHDRAAVFGANDDWVLIESAARQMNLAEHTLSQSLRSGRYRAVRGYFADGDRTPPGLRWAIHRDEITAYNTRYSLLTRSGVQQVLAVNRKRLAVLEQAGLLAPTRRHAGTSYFDQQAVSALYARYLQLVIDALQGSGRRACLPSEIRQAIIALAKQDRLSTAVLLPHPPKLGIVQVRHWLDDLQSAGAVRRLGNGRYELLRHADSEAAAARAVGHAATKGRPGPKREQGSFTPRQVEVLEAVATTQTIAEAARLLGVTPQGVCGVLRRIAKNNDVVSVHDVARRARDGSLLPDAHASRRRLVEVSAAARATRATPATGEPAAQSRSATGTSDDGSAAERLAG